MRHVAPGAPLQKDPVGLGVSQPATSATRVGHAVAPPRRHQRRLRADHLLPRQVGRVLDRIRVAPEVVVAVPLGKCGFSESIFHRVSLRGDAEIGRERLVVAARLHQGF
jgi:hypothetical protein